MSIHHSAPGQLALFPELLLFNGACFRRGDALDAGMSNDEITEAVRRGQVRHLLREVYADAARPDGLGLRVEALRLVLPPEAVVARGTAAWLRGVDIRAPGRQHVLPEVECTVPLGRARLKRDGVRSFISRLDGDVEVVGGVPVTTPARTAVDLLRWTPPYLGLAAADALAHRRLVDPGDLREAVERWRGDRNVAVARRLAALCDPGTESPGESWTRLRLAEAGFPRPRVQVPLLRDGLVVYRLDLGWEEQRLAIEFDGAEHHSSREQRAHDERRRAAVRAEFGWTVVPVNRGDVLGRSMLLEQAVGELLGLEPRIRRRAW